MVSESNIRDMENIIIKHAGPMGKFVIKKALADMDTNLENYDPVATKKLIDLVVQRAIFDTSKRDSVRKEILTAWGI